MTERWTRRLASGEHADPTGVRCPRRGCGGEVVYNGNYFCEHWAYVGEPPRALEPTECDWALGATDAWQARELYGDVLHAADVRVWRELRRTYPPLVESRRRHERNEP